MKKTYSLTETQEGLLRFALSVAIEQDETFWVDGLHRDSQTAADYRGLLILHKMFGGRI
jgi:hypothetical protein